MKRLLRSAYDLTPLINNGSHIKRRAKTYIHTHTYVLHFKVASFLIRLISNWAPWHPIRHEGSVTSPSSWLSGPASRSTPASQTSG